MLRVLMVLLMIPVNVYSENTVIGKIKEDMKKFILIHARSTPEPIIYTAKDIEPYRLMLTGSRMIIVFTLYGELHTRHVKKIIIKPGESTSLDIVFKKTKYGIEILTTSVSKYVFENMFPVKKECLID